MLCLRPIPEAHTDYFGDVAQGQDAPSGAYPDCQHGAGLWFTQRVTRTAWSPSGRKDLTYDYFFAPSVTLLAAPVVYCFHDGRGPLRVI